MSIQLAALFEAGFILKEENPLLFLGYEAGVEFRRKDPGFEFMSQHT
jgi:hypothetical protein